MLAPVIIMNTGVTLLRICFSVLFLSVSSRERSFARVGGRQFSGEVSRQKSSHHLGLCLRRPGTKRGVRERIPRGHSRGTRTWWDGPDRKVWPDAEVCSAVWAFEAADAPSTVLVLPAFCSQTSCRGRQNHPASAAPGVWNGSPRQRTRFCSQVQRPGGCFSFLWEGCSSKRWLGHEAREEAELPRWHCLFCLPLVLI